VVYENRILELLIRDGMQSWSDLWNKIDWRGNKRFLRDCLSSLIDGHKIVRFEVSHKNVRFAWAGDIEILEKLRADILRRDEFFPKVRKGIAETKNDADIKRVTEFFAAFMFAELGNYLKALAVWVDADKKWKDIAKFFILRYNVKCLSLILMDCKKANPEAFGKALDGAFETLSKLSAEIWPKAPS
jgi:hypothetical protein